MGLRCLGNLSAAAELCALCSVRRDCRALLYLLRTVLVYLKADVFRVMGGAWT